MAAVVPGQALHYFNQTSTATYNSSPPEFVGHIAAIIAICMCVFKLLTLFEPIDPRGLVIAAAAFFSACLRASTSILHRAREYLDGFPRGVVNAAFVSFRWVKDVIWSSLQPKRVPSSDVNRSATPMPYPTRWISQINETFANFVPDVMELLVLMKKDLNFLVPAITDLKKRMDKVEDAQANLFVRLDALEDEFATLKAEAQSVGISALTFDNEETNVPADHRVASHLSPVMEEDPEHSPEHDGYTKQPVIVDRRITWSTIYQEILPGHAVQGSGLSSRVSEWQGGHWTWRCRHSR